jgi:hypothetical protein
MKTSLFFNAGYPLSLWLLACATLLLPWSACTDPEDLKFRPFTGYIDPVSDYVGNFDLMEDDCHSPAYVIEISRVPLDIQDANPKIYIFNLVNNERSVVVAEWDGGAFVIKNQDYMLQQELVQVTGRLYEYEGELSVSYELTGPDRQHSCSGKFRKMD